MIAEQEEAFVGKSENTTRHPALTRLVVSVQLQNVRNGCAPTIVSIALDPLSVKDEAQDFEMSAAVVSRTNGSQRQHFLQTSTNRSM